MKRIAIPFLIAAITLVCMNASFAKCKGKAEMRDADGLYFQKNFNEALKHYLSAYENGCQDGITAYKIAYCYMKAGNSEKDKEYLTLAVDKLTTESAAKPTLENLFYLANCYINLNQKDKAIEVSSRTVDLFEKGSLGKAKDAISTFRIGKVCFDAQKYEKGIEYYRKAYALSKKEKQFPQEYRKMILQRLAEYDYRANYLAGAYQEFKDLVEVDSKYDDAYYYLATVSMNLGKYEEAESAWKKVIELGLPNSDEAQYNHRIARAAIDESPLPKSGKSGKDFKEMNKTELEEAIIAISKEGTDLKKEALEKKGDLQEIANGLKSIRKLFIAACAEYISRGLFIRDNAIMNGFAVQIMRKDAWELPPEE